MSHVSDARSGPAWPVAGPRMRTGLLLCAPAVFALPAWGAEPADAERGRLLYENHCTVCHTPRVHRRSPPLPIDLKDLRRIVAGWAKQQNLSWSEAEVSDVVEYLDRTYYRMLRR